MCICWSQLSLFGVNGGGAWLVGGYLVLACACTTRSIETAFSIPCMSTVTVFGCRLMMQNGFVLLGRSLWYAPVTSWCAP